MGSRATANADQFMASPMSTAGCGARHCSQSWRRPSSSSSFPAGPVNAMEFRTSFSGDRRRGASRSRDDPRPRGDGDGRRLHLSRIGRRRAEVEAACRAFGVRCLALPCDQRREEEVRAVVARVTNELAASTCWSTAPPCSSVCRGSRSMRRPGMTPSPPTCVGRSFRAPRNCCAQSGPGQDRERRGHRRHPSLGRLSAVTVGRGRA